MKKYIGVLTSKKSIITNCNCLAMDDSFVVRHSFNLSNLASFWFKASKQPCFISENLFIVTNATVVQSDIALFCSSFWLTMSYNWVIIQLFSLNCDNNWWISSSFLLQSCWCAYDITKMTSTCIPFHHLCFFASSKHELSSSICNSFSEMFLAITCNCSDTHVLFPGPTWFEMSSRTLRLSIRTSSISSDKLLSVKSSAFLFTFLS